MSEVLEPDPQGSRLRDLHLGTNRAWEWFFEIVRKAIGQLGRTFTIPPGARDDVAQQIALRAWRRFSSAKGLLPRNDDDLPGWILLLSHNVCVDLFRRRDRKKEEEPRLGPPAESHPPEHLRTEELEHFEHILQPILRPDCQRVVWLHCAEDWTFPEISLDTGVPESTLRSRYSRAIQRLRPRLLGGVPPPPRLHRSQCEA